MVGITEQPTATGGHLMVDPITLAIMVAITSLVALDLVVIALLFLRTLHLLLGIAVLPPL